MKITVTEQIHLSELLPSDQAACIEHMKAKEIYDLTLRIPYPYTEAHEGQKEVDRLVDLVREVWERPFDLVSTWEKSLVAAMALVSEVDEVLAKVEEGYSPDVDVVKAAINKAIDMPGVMMDETSKKVLAYNEKVATSATPQEKDNVRAVNEYRMMMGRIAVKINERLELIILERK